jgi:sugar diacid utilization regulator
MSTLETVLHDLQQAPPEHVEQVRQLLQQLKTEANQKLLVETLRILEGTDDLPAETWAEIEAHQRRLRQELFTRPMPEL